MITTTMREEIRALVAASLHGLSIDDLADCRDGSLLLEPISLYGDAVRCDVPIPREIRRWSKALTSDLITGIADSLQTEITQSKILNENANLARLVRRRDQAASAVLALQCICFAQGIALGSLPSLGTLDASLAELDEKLRTLISQPEVLKLLGNRQALQNESSWTVSFPSVVTQQQLHDLAGSISHDRLAEVHFSDAMIHDYVRHGSFSSVIEKAASVRSELADSLSCVVSTLIEANEPVSLMAYKWHYAKSKQPNATKIAVLPPARLAAASDADLDSRLEYVELGWLGEIRALAKLSISATNVTLSVYPEKSESLLSVAFGARRTDTQDPTDPDKWSIGLPIVEIQDPVLVRVLSADGRRFETPISLATRIPE